MSPLRALVRDYRAHPEIAWCHGGIVVFATAPLLIVGPWPRGLIIGLAAIAAAIGSSWLTIGCRRMGTAAMLIAIAMVVGTIVWMQPRATEAWPSRSDLRHDGVMSANV